MICARLLGGLGNQLFQYAAARALALHHGTGVLLDTSAFALPSLRRTARTFELFNWCVQARVASGRELCGLNVARRIPVVSRLVSPWRAYAERGFEYNRAFLLLPDRTYLIGYWQSPRYFSECAEAIATEITPVQRLSDVNAEIADRIEACVSVAVHVRRGDYVSRPSTAALHGALPLTYYIAAIKRLRAEVNMPYFYVFSDDPDWCRTQLPLGPNEATIVDHNRGANAWQDLVLMSHCRHQVIANSSFSWWGAWLADQRYRGASRHVIAPARWFAGEPHDATDRFLPHWVVLA